MIRIMLVDDHVLFRKGLRALIEQKPDLCVVAEAADAREALEAYGEHRPDITLMDVRLPGTNGIQATRSILAHDPDAKVVILSATDFDDQVIESIHAGAVGYLAKNLEPDELFFTIESVYRSGFCLDKTHVDQIMRAMATREDTHNAEPAEQSKPLSPREWEILELVAEGRTNKEIASDLVIALNTVKAHISNIMGKLGLRNRVELTAYAIANRDGLK